jgi:DNA-binding transcriptional LysR family regulator
LRVTTTTGIGTIWLAPRLYKLYETYPDLKIDLMMEERVLDLPMREADVAIRMKEPSQADLIRKRLMFVRIGLYATREYIARHGAPETLDDMKNHRLIFQNPKSPQVLAGQNLVRELMTYEIGSTLTVNNYFGVLQAAIHNLGIGMLPDYVTHAIDTMVRVLPDVESMEVPVYLAYPEELRHSKRIEAFRDFVEKEILEDKRKSRQEVSP